MRKELKAIEISNIPELVRIAERVHRTGESRVLRRKKETLAIVKPVRAFRRILRGKPTTANDSLWNIVGIARSEGATDVSENKHKYLAEAYATRTQ